MDTPETLAAALLLSAAEAVAGTRAIVQKGALNVKTEAKANVERSAPVHNAHAADAITYDTKIHPTTVEAEIGYDKNRKPGRIGNLLEFGGGKDHSPPHRDLGRALEAEDPRFVAALEAMADKLL
jgi:hypothetical protein